MLCKCKCKYNISIVSSVSTRSVNKIAFGKKKRKACYNDLLLVLLNLTDLDPPQGVSGRTYSGNIQGNIFCGTTL